MNTLALNSRSSILKFQLIFTDPNRVAQDRDERLCRGLIERIGGGVEGQISTPDSALHAFVIPTNEELLIARDTVRLIRDQAQPNGPQDSSKIGALRLEQAQGQ